MLDSFLALLWTHWLSLPFPPFLAMQIALHGTDGLPDQLWLDCVKAGARK
jgi:hypothetical protein